MKQTNKHAAVQEAVAPASAGRGLKQAFCRAVLTAACRPRPCQLRVPFLSMPGYCTDGSCLGAFHDSCFALSRVPRSAYICSHCVSGTVCARLCASDGILRLSSTAKWQDDFVYTKLYLALPFSMSNLRTDCQQVRAAEVSAGSVQMTVRRSAGVEVVKGSVRSAWYAEPVLSFAFGSVEGSAGVLPARMRQQCAFGEQERLQICCRACPKYIVFWSTHAILH